MGRVFVAGSINMDVVATAERHPKVGETVAGKEVLYFPGGKGANQAVSAAKLGATTALIGRLGNDSFGTELRSFLQVQGVDLSLVADTADAHTGTAIITLANADNTIVVIPGANGLLSPEDVANAPLAKGDVAVSQFEIPLPTIKAFFQRARTAGALTILNPAPARACDAELLDLVDVLVLNETELGLPANAELREDEDIEHVIDAAKTLGAGHGKVVCVTLGSRGARGRRAFLCRGPQSESGRYHRRRRLLRRRAGHATRKRSHASRRAGLRECSRFNLRAANGRRAVDAGGGGGGRGPEICRVGKGALAACPPR
jgi:ribokinase